MTSRQGEQLIIDFLESGGALVTDVSNEPSFWALDIDLIAQKDNSIATIEVKTDSRIAQTRNFFLEIENPRSKGGAGWFEFTKADLLYYLDSQNLVVYVFQMDQLKKFVKRNRRNLRTAAVYDGAAGLLLPLDVAPIHSILYLDNSENLK